MVLAISLVAIISVRLGLHAPGRTCARTPPTSMNLMSTARLLLSDVTLKVQVALDPDMQLYALPQRDLIRSRDDLYTIAKAFPESARDQFLDWYEGYRLQVTAPKPKGPGLTDDDVFVIFNRMVDRMILLSKQKYEFECRHEGITSPYDYFEFGQEYIRPLVDFDNSYVRNMEYWDEATNALQRGENVVLLANHQTEADAAFLPLFFESNPLLGRGVYYVAGGRVVGDPLAQPFSMGRNLFCVHSKKYIDAETDQEQKSAMSKQNRKTLTEMSKAMKKGGVLIWIAPSGGRDRLDADGRPTPAAFDPAVVETFRSLGEKAKKPTHLYPMAMATYSIMPPPSGRQKDLGEKRVTKFTGCAISLGPEVDQSPAAAWRSAESPKEALCAHVYDEVCKEYDLLEGVMAGFGEDGYAPPNSAQPWMKAQK